MLVLAARAWACEAFSLQTIFKTNCENSEIYFLPYFSTHSPCACDNFSHTFPSRALFLGRQSVLEFIKFWQVSGIFIGVAVDHRISPLGTKQLLRRCDDTSEAAICLSRLKLSSIKSCFFARLLICCCAKRLGQLIHGNYGRSKAPRQKF